MTACMFPRGDRVLLERWINQVGRKDWWPTKSSVLCSKHFAANAYGSSPDLKGRKLLKWAVPTIFDFPPQKNDKQERNSSEKRLNEDGDCEERPKCDQSTESHPHTFKIQQTIVEIKIAPNVLPFSQKSREKAGLSSNVSFIEETQSDKSFPCEWTRGPCPQQHEVLEMVEELQNENKKLKKEVKMLQQKIRRRDTKLQQIAKQVGLDDG